MAISRLHPHLIEGITNALLEIFQGGRYADKVVEVTLKSRSKWGARDRRFFAESVYECVRWWRRLSYVAFGESSEAAGSEKYQDKDFLTYSKVEKIWYVWWMIRNKDQNEVIEKRDIKKKFDGDPVSLWNTSNSPRALRESIPDWLDAEGEREVGKNWDAVLSALNLPAFVYLRVNRIKTNRENLIKELLKDEITPVPVDQIDALRLNERKNVFITSAFKAGFFEVQDLGSQKIATFLDLEPGMRVIDACAGGGGKSLHIASLMKNKGRIIALDKNEWRLSPLRQRAARAGADIIETKVITSNKIIKRLYESADRLLLDVPCTGLGVLRRSPDTKWKLNQSDITNLLHTQQEILQNYSSMSAKGGIMVYSTCSIFPSENQKQVEIFLNSPAGKQWQLIEDLNIYPSASRVLKGSYLFDNCDGFYMAKLRRI